MLSTAVAAERNQSSRRGLIAPLTATAGAAALAVYTAVGNPYEAGHFPACVYYSLSGLYCPGCGGLRAAHELLNGDFSAAMGMNPYAVLVLIPLAGVSLVWWVGAKAGLGWKAPRLSSRVIWVMISTAFIFAVLRNIPQFAPYLAP